MSYVQAIPPKNYCVRDVRYCCSNCGKSFSVLYPEHNELVKYVETDSGEERWLPTFGDLGYLDLMERLVPSFSKGSEISMSISREFEKEFSRIQERSESGRPFSLFIKAICPNCEGENLQIEQEQKLESPPLPWMRFWLED